MSRIGGSLARAAGATLLALGLVGLPATAPQARAAGDSYVTGATTYVADPATAAIHVTVDMTFKDTKPDTDTVRYYFTGYRLGIQKEAVNVHVTSGSRTLATTIKPTTANGASFLALDITFAARVYRNQTTAFRIRYDLPDSGPRSTGAVRVGAAVIGFYAWSYGPDRASVAIDLPAGFEPTTQGDPLVARTNPDGSTTLSAADIADRGTWFAWISAQRPAALTRVVLQVPIEGTPEPIEIRAFPEDATWLDAVRSRLSQALPVLGRLIGLPWPVSGTLVVSETYTPLLGGYAGFFNQGDVAGQADSISITEDPDPLVIVHESTHAWFNADLFTGRWINEGLADEYASRALAQAGQTGYDPERVVPTDTGAFPLDAWPAPGRINDPSTSQRERYGYNASWTVVRALLDEIGTERMAAVFKAAAARQLPFVGRPAPERMSLATGSPDWHVFLDLLEQVGGSKRAEGLFASWVVTAVQRPQLTAHTAAVAAYGQLLARGRGWLPGAVVRRPMAAWDFAAARDAMAAANAVLAQRDAIDAAAASLGLPTTRALQRAYESATSDLAAARVLAAEQLATLGAIRRARTTVDAPRDLLTSLGLIGADPGPDLAAAARSFETDDLAGARASAGAAERLVHDAAAAGRQRLETAGAGLLAFLVAGGMVALWIRRRRRARARAAATLGASPAQKETRGG